MNIKPRFKTIIIGILCCLSPLSSYGAANNDAVIVVKGTVTKGTCGFTLSDQSVKFSQPTLMQNVAEIGEKEENKIPFLVNYLCQDYVDEMPDMEVTIQAGAGTQIVNNKIAPVNNPTNASFVIYDCKTDNCTLVHFNGGSSTVYLTTGNGNKNKVFEVELVRNSTAEVKPGTLNANLTLTFVQP